MLAFEETHIERGSSEMRQRRVTQWYSKQFYRFDEKAEMNN